MNEVRQHFSRVVLDPLGLPIVGEAASHAQQQADLAIYLAQQQRASPR